MTVLDSLLMMVGAMLLGGVSLLILVILVITIVFGIIGVVGTIAGLIKGNR